MNKKQKIKNIIKKCLCCFGVVFALTFSIFTFKNTNNLLLSFADTPITSFLGSNFNIKSIVEKDESVIDNSSAWLNLKFNFNNVNGSTLNIDYSGIAEILSPTDTLNAYEKSTTNVNQFVNVEQGDTLYHYQFNANLDLTRGDDFLFTDTFYCNNKLYNRINFNQFLVSQEGFYSYYENDKTKYSIEVYVDGSFLDSVYRDIYVVNSISSSLSNYLNSHAIFIDTISSTEFNIIDTLALPLSSTDKNVVETNILLDSANKKYFPLVVIADKLDNLDFLGVNLKYDTTTINEIHYLVEYFNSSGGTLTLDFRVFDLSSLPEKTYYFTSTSQDNYNLGYSAGYSAGESAGYSSGYSAGSDAVSKPQYDAGYSAGYLKGASESNNYTFFGLISAVFDAPIQTLKGLFNFELLGVNLFNFVCALFTLAIILTIVKFVI